MFRSAAARFASRRSTGVIRRSYSSTHSDKTSAEVHKLAEEALAQKTGVKSKATLPKGDKRPAKAAGEGDGHWKAYAVGAGAVTGAVLGGLFYYGRFACNNSCDFNRLTLDRAASPRTTIRWRSRRQGDWNDKQRKATVYINMEDLLYAIYSTSKRMLSWPHITAVSTVTKSLKR